MPDGWMLFNYPAQLWTPYRLGPGYGGPDRVVPVARLRPAVTIHGSGGHESFCGGLGEAFPSTNKGWESA